MDSLRSDSQTTAHGQLPVLLATSNGTGLGHLTRQLAVALGLADQADATIFSLSTGLPTVSHFGVRGEYCPSYDRGWMPRAWWHGYLRDRLVALVEETGARLVVFDGVVPYLGVLRARAAMPEVAFVWMRRGMWRRRSSTSALASRPFFDLVIEPGDLAMSADEGPTAQLGDSVHVPPVMLQEFLPALSRAEAAAELGLDPDRPAALVTLSSGRLNDVETAGAAAVRALLADPEWQVAVTRSHVAQGKVPLIDPTRVVALQGVYPLSRYLTAFDAAVGAAGYNTFHEMLLSGIPTLFVPNRSSETDDQMARARWANVNGLALVANELDVCDVEAQASRLHNEGERKQLAGACATLPPATGGTAAAHELLDLMIGFTGHRPTSWERVRAAELVGKAAAIRALGGFGYSLVRRTLGKPAEIGPRRPLSVTVMDHASVVGRADLPGRESWIPVVATDRIDPELTRSPYPVEHLIEGASAEYWRRRFRITRRYYRVKNQLDNDRHRGDSLGDAPQVRP